MKSAGGRERPGGKAGCLVEGRWLPAKEGTGSIQSHRYLPRAEHCSRDWGTEQEDTVPVRMKITFQFEEPGGRFMNKDINKIFPSKNPCWT